MEPPPPPEPGRVRAVSLWGQVVSGVLITLGLLAVLRGGRSGFGEEPRAVLIFDLHPVTGLVHLALGLAGVYLVTEHARARAYLTAVGVLLVAWGLLTAVAGGSPRELLADDTALVVLYLVGGAVSLAVVHARGRGRGRAAAPDPPG